MKKPPSSNPPTKDSPNGQGMASAPLTASAKQRRQAAPPRRGRTGSRGWQRRPSEPAERGPGSASGGVQGGECAEAIGGRDGPPARGNSGTDGPPDEHDTQGTPHQVSASGGLQAVGGPGVRLAGSRMNDAPSDHDEASPVPEGESSKAPLRSGDPSSSPGRSTGKNSRGGGTTPSGGGRENPSAAGPPIPDPAEDPPGKSLVAQVHPHDSSETVATRRGSGGPGPAEARGPPSKQPGRPRAGERIGHVAQEMEQFVTRFKLLRKAAPGQGRDIEVQPGPERAFNDEPASIALDWGTVGNLATRSAANVVDDQQRDNVEGIRFVVPSELRSGFEAYKRSLSHSIPTRP